MSDIRTDREILALYAARDERAVSETARVYGGLCRQIARNILGNEQDAEECVNDTYLRLWETIPPSRPDKLGAFAAKILRNIALNTVTRLSALKRGGGESETPFDEIAGCIPSGESVEKSAAEKPLFR